MQFQQNQKVNITGGTVTVGSITGTVNVAGTVAISGGSVSISGTPNVNVTGGSITISSGSVTISSGTITSIVNNVNVNLAAESIVNTTNNFGTGNYDSGVLTLTQQIQGVKVFLSTASANVHNLEITAVNNTNFDEATVDVQINNAYPQLGAGSGFLSVPINLAGDVGDSVRFTVTKLAGGGAGALFNIIVLGLGVNPAIRTTPGLPINIVPTVGSLKAHASIAATATTAILPAPPTGMAYAVHRVVYKWSGAAASAFLLGAVSNFFYDFTPGVQANPLFGLQALEGLSVLNNSATVAMDAYIFYDLISVPTIV